MRRFTFGRLLVALFLWLPVSGQIVKYKKCDPLNGGGFCTPNPALASTIDVDFTVSTLTDLDHFAPLEGTEVLFEQGKGASFVIETEKQKEPSLVLDQYIFFGRVEVVLRSARGKGIITSVMLQSDTLDEVYFVSLRTGFCLRRGHVLLTVPL